MEERIAKVLAEIDEAILSYKGDNLFDAGLLDSFVTVDLVSMLEEEFDVDIDAEYVTEENFKTKESITLLMTKLTSGERD